MGEGEGRALKKKEARERIILAASGLFIERGARSVSMDQVAEAADVARRTLFNYFESKDDLLFAVASPMLQEAASLAKERLDAGSPSLDSVLGLCLDLWSSWGRRLSLLYSVDLADSGRLAALHGDYLALFQRLVSEAIAAEPALLSQGRLVGRAIYRGFVPVLMALDGVVPADGGQLEARFRAGLKGLLSGLVSVS